MFNKVILFVSAILCMAKVTHAQELQPCSSDEHYRALVKQYPQLEEYEKQFESQLSARLASKTTSAIDTTTYDIPLVVHVIHDYGVENISDDIIYQAAAYWAVVYMEQNADTASVIPTFKPYIGNPNIRLHLATIDPNGKPTKGVVRQQSYLTNTADDQAKYNQWPPNKYVNVWLINAFGAADAGAAAYAYYPSSAVFMPYYDGVICLASYANYAKTVPHEIGHVLNLEHPWGNTNAPAVACGDDLVDDTPPTKGHTPVGCVASALYDTDCATGYTKTYMSASGLMDSVYDYPDTTNAQNIMDYTYCQSMFTKGQVARMRTALTGSTADRNNLITPANLAATGALAPMPDLPPVADYIVDKATGVGLVTDARSYFLTFNNTASFVFRNESWNDTIASVKWIFSNDATTPTATSMTTVVNKFATPGWVTVSLVANSNAGTDTITNTQAVYAADTTAVGGIGYAQSFASPAAMSNWPMFNYYNNQFKWETYNGAGYGDNACIRYRSFDTSDRIFGNAVGDFDDIYTPAFNLEGISDSLYFNFFSTGAYTTHGISGFATAVKDSLEIDASTNGGVKWTKIGGYTGNQLANNGSLGTEFVPNSATPWIPRAVSIPAAYRTGNTFFRMRYRPGNEGNNLYVDYMYLYQLPAGVKETVDATNSFNIYPNPTSTGCVLAFKTGADGVVNFTIKDITGKTVYQTQKTYTANSLHQESISRAVTPVAGMYFVTVTIDGVNATQKLVVY